MADIVSFNCESQNSFGGYVNSKCYVLIEQYDTSTDKFRWNSDYGYQIDNFGLSSETFVEMLKEYTNWDEPFEDEEE